MVMHAKVTIKSTDFRAGADLSFNMRNYGKALDYKGRNAAIKWANTVVKEAKDILDKEVKYHGPERNRLRDSIRVISVSPKDRSYTVGTTVPYAPHVEYGVARHIIKAKGKALKFMSTASMGGVEYHTERGTTRGPVFVRKVEHPGFEGKFFMARAFNRGVEASRIELARPINLKEPIKIPLIRGAQA